MYSAPRSRVFWRRTDAIRWIRSALTDSCVDCVVVCADASVGDGITREALRGTYGEEGTLGKAEASVVLWYNGSFPAPVSRSVAHKESERCQRIPQHSSSQLRQQDALPSEAPASVKSVNDVMNSLSIRGDDEERAAKGVVFVTSTPDDAIARYLRSRLGDRCATAVFLPEVIPAVEPLY